ncbi:general transcription factor 3C polypeptide 4-like [Procambarus clarkii]|uniref:general transcription factor 3C polypeptide 4-like n=1 Tax=Procambarus clarkii TaxID=6728 RepID=UPI00374363A1
MQSRCDVQPNLHPSTSGPCPYTNIGIDVKRLVEHVERTTGHAVMLDSVLSTPQRIVAEHDPRNVRNISPAMPGGDINHMGYRRGAWSPYGVGEQGRCLLALATHDQRVNIVGRVGRKWEKLWDLSVHWHRHISSNSWAAVAGHPHATQLETYTARMHMLSVYEFQWTPVYEDSQGSFSILITLTAGSHAVFWRIPTNFTGAEEVRILTIQKMDITLASAIHWHSITNKVGYLIVGSSSGLVKVCYCQLDGDDAVMTDLGFAYDVKDRMRVNHIHLSHVTADQYLLLAAKHNVLLASTVKLSTDNLTVACAAFSHVGKLAISGLVVLKNKNVYVSVKDGTLQHLVVSISPEGEVSLKEHGAIFRSEGVAYTGLMTSPNQTLWGIFESVSVAYDHLVVREPTQISIYQVGCSAKLARYVLESERPLHSNADVLESLRITSCKEGVSPVIPMQSSEIPDQPLQLLKANYWLAKMSRSVGITDEATLATLDEVEPMLQTSILEHWIMQMLNRFITDDVSQQQRSILLSFSLMCEWIMKNGRDDNKEIAEVFAKKLGHVDQEVCLVCQEPIQLDFLTHGKCRNGHTLPRCCRSLLLTKPTIFCPRCRVFTHKDAAYFEGTMSSTCTYCDGFVVDELRERRQQLQAVKNEDEGVSGCSPSVKQTKRKH